MANWIVIDQSDLDLDQLETIRGVQVHVTTSPYDVPKAIRGYYCDDRDRFVIEFRYLSGEPLVWKKYNSYTDVEEGSRSGRIYKIAIDVDGASASRIDLVVQEHDANALGVHHTTKVTAGSTAQFENTFDQMRGSLEDYMKDSKQSENARVISEVLGKKHDRLKRSFQGIG